MKRLRKRVLAERSRNSKTKTAEVHRFMFWFNEHTDYRGQLCGVIYADDLKQLCIVYERVN